MTEITPGPMPFRFLLDEAVWQARRHFRAIYPAIAIPVTILATAVAAGPGGLVRQAQAGPRQPGDAIAESRVPGADPGLQRPAGGRLQYPAGGGARRRRRPARRPAASLALHPAGAGAGDPGPLVRGDLRLHILLLPAGARRGAPPHLCPGGDGGRRTFRVPGGRRSARLTGLLPAGEMVGEPAGQGAPAAVGGRAPDLPSGGPAGEPPLPGAAVYRHAPAGRRRGGHHAGSFLPGLAAGAGAVPELSRQHRRLSLLLFGVALLFHDTRGRREGERPARGGDPRRSFRGLDQLPGESRP